MGRSDAENAELHNAELRAPACRKCGCTDTDCAGCIERTGAPCWWVERDLCSACCDVAPELLPAESLARGLCVRHGLPGAMVLALDADGGLHVGCAAVDHPITQRFVELARSLNLAIERGVPGFAGITREQAVDIAQRTAKAKPQSYYAEPFEPHEWVVDAILQAASRLPPVRATCTHCGHEVAGIDDVDAIRAHSMTCDKSPVVQELQRLRAIADQPQVIEILFDGPPSPPGGRFVEVEDGNGRSISIGSWLDRGDGYHVLRIERAREVGGTSS